MALPRTKYSDPRHTPGNEFTLAGKDYIGWYVETYQNKFYTGKYIDDFSQEILPKELVQLPDSPIYVEEVLTPSEDDRKIGRWTRYFIQNANNRSIIEVSRERYNTFKGSSKYLRAKLEWVIKGPAENLLKRDYVYYGAIHQNSQSVNTLEKTFPGIKQYITNYSEFVE